MEKIKELLVKLDNKVTPSLKKRIDGFNNLIGKLSLAKAEYEQDPTEENKEDLEQIQEYVLDVQEDLIDDLQDLLDEREAEKQKSQSSVQNPVIISDKEGKEEEDGSGVLGALGVVLAIGVGVFTLGQLNLFGKK